LYISDSEPQISCPNCGQEFNPDNRFCPGCGQKSRTTLISFKELLGDFFDSVFNLNSRFFVTLKRLFIPGYLTREFFRGKHVHYFSPLRLFFVTLLALYTVLGVTYRQQLEVHIGDDNEYHAFKAHGRAEALVTSAIAKLGYDTLSTAEQRLLDSLAATIHNTPMDSGPGMEINVSIDSSVILQPEDIYELELDSVFRKYDLTSFWERLITRQLIRARRDPAKAVLALIGNTSWMILLLMPALALWMKLLYLRRKKFYVEHVVFLFHYHAAVFVTLMAYIPLLQYMPWWVDLSVPLVLFGFLYVAMLRYYGQGWFKTSIKLGLLSVAYLFVLIVFSGLTMAISLIVFQ
jgi:hypothetical protein